MAVCIEHERFHTAAILTSTLQLSTAEQRPSQLSWLGWALAWLGSGLAGLAGLAGFGLAWMAWLAWLAWLADWLNWLATVDTICWSSAYGFAAAGFVDVSWLLTIMSWTMMGVMGQRECHFKTDTYDLGGYFRKRKGRE